MEPIFNSMQVIGVTGHSCAGKTTLLKTIKKFPVIFLDDLVSNLYKKKSVKKELKQKIGRYTKKSVLKALKKDPEKIFLLEKILHPKTKNALKKKLSELKKKKCSIVLVETPLLFEAGWEDMFNKTVLVTAPKKVLMQRIKKNKKIIPRELLKRRMSQSVLKKKANFVVNTNQDIEKSKKKMFKVLELIQNE